MDYTYNFLDVLEFEEKKIQPSCFVDRTGGDKWLICGGPIEGPGKIQWMLCQDGDRALIPLFPYMAQDDDPAVALAFAFQLGLFALFSFEPPGRIVGLHITISDKIQEVSDNTGAARFRFWLGFAFKVRNQ